MSQTIAIALSGGIDSLAAATLLKDQGHQVIGLHFVTGFEPDYLDTNAPSSTVDFEPLEKKARQHLGPMADQLDIPLYVVDLRSDFKRVVVDYFVRTYQAGKTPNPCLKCNPSIKFDRLYQQAQQFGASGIATGHYAQIKPCQDGLMCLFRGVDAVKDQSYFLARMKQDQLRSTHFPLGGFTKNHIRQLVKERGLKPAAVQESQDICFIKNNTYGQFLTQQPGFTARPGPIVDMDGNEIGQHHGLHLFTIGQRRGINCPAAQPYYVVRIDPDGNRLIVGQKNDLLTSDFQVEDINWIISCPDKPIQIDVRVRYRHQAVPATLTALDGTHAQISFNIPQPAVTPGQGAVFYEGDQVLGGGWIL